MGIALIALGLVMTLFACTVVALELGMRLVLLLAWTTAWLGGHRPSAALFRLMLEARAGSREARVDLERAWAEANRSNGLAY